MTSIETGSWEDTVEKFKEYLNSRNYSNATIQSYCNGCEALTQYIRANPPGKYDEEMCRKYCFEILNGRDYSELSKRDQKMIRCANVLLEFMETGTISQKIRWKNNEMTGLCSDSIREFLSELKNQRLSENTVKSYKLYLVRFNDYIVRNDIDSFADITPGLLLGYVKSLEKQGHAAKHMAIRSANHYLRFLYDKGYLKTDYSQVIPKDNYNGQARLPSLYTDEEISKMLGAVDRGSPKGKRDYAMLLLSSHLGLRAGDICQLQFSEIDWEHDKISLVQKKTGVPIELPLLPAIGNAIVDYLRYGRPKSSSDYVFLRHVPDYGCLTYSTFYCIVTEYFLRAGISIDGRRHGSHALRHSLAGRMLGANVPLPIISETLGHTNTESTKHYLRIDVTKLRQCALDVPATDFYKDNRGWK